MNVHIFATKFVMNLAETLAQNLRQQEANYNVTVNIRQLTSVDIDTANGSTNTVLFIFCPHIFLQARNGPHWPKSLPTLNANKYILYQLEQLDQPQVSSVVFWNPHILNLMENALFIYDYSEHNLTKYPVSLRAKRAWLVPPIVNVERLITTSDKSDQCNQYDVLFMGTITPYRQRMLSYIRQMLPASLRWHYVHNVFGEDLTAQIKQAKVVLNIRTGASEQLEICRLHECLALNVQLVSEHKCKESNIDCVCKLYEDRVYFAETPHELVQSLSKALSAPLKQYSPLKNLESLIKQSSVGVSDVLNKNFLSGI
jgi:hypothetical protein